MKRRNSNGRVKKNIEVKTDVKQEPKMSDLKDNSGLRKNMKYKHSCRIAKVEE